MNLVNYIENHPTIALIVGGTHLAIAESLKPYVIPDLVMQVFQIGAWGVTITVGVVSLYGTYKKFSK